MSSLQPSDTERLSTPLPPSAIDADAPTSRSTFRLLAGCIEATNREADTLRHALLARWADDGGSLELSRQLQSLDHADPAGALGVESRLAIWFAPTDPGDGSLVAEGDSLLAGLSDGLRTRLAAIARPTSD